MHLEPGGRPLQERVDSAIWLLEKASDVWLFIKPLIPCLTDHLLPQTLAIAKSIGYNFNSILMLRFKKVSVSYMYLTNDIWAFFREAFNDFETEHGIITASSIFLCFEGGYFLCFSGIDLLGFDERVGESLEGEDGICKATFPA